MPNLPSTSARLAEEARRRRQLRLAIQAAAVLLADFVLLRLLAPDLVNMHRDWALVTALLCIGLALALTLWLAVTIWRRWPALVRPKLRIATRDRDMET